MYIPLSNIQYYITRYQVLHPAAFNTFFIFRLWNWFPLPDYTTVENSTLSDHPPNPNPDTRTIPVIFSAKCHTCVKIGQNRWYFNVSNLFYNISPGAIPAASDRTGSPGGSFSHRKIGPARCSLPPFRKNRNFIPWKQLPILNHTK